MSFNPQRLVGAAATSSSRVEYVIPTQVSILSGSSEPLQLDARIAGVTVLLVSILSGSSEPLQLDARIAGVTVLLVSILSGSSEPLQPPAPGPLTGPARCFNPQRLVGAAATTEPNSSKNSEKFQSSAARRSRCNFGGSVIS